MDTPSGAIAEPYGPSPTGYHIFMPGGELSVQMMRSPALPAFAGGDAAPTDAERRALFDGYIGYYGTYTVLSDSTMVYRLQGSTSPSWVGTDQPRSYRIMGDTLRIGGSPLTWPCRVLIRVPASAALR